MSYTQLSHVFVSQPTYRQGVLEYGHTQRDGRISSLTMDFTTAVRAARLHWPDLINDLTLSRPMFDPDEPSPVPRRRNVWTSP